MSIAAALATLRRLLVGLFGLRDGSDMGTSLPLDDRKLNTSGANNPS